MTSAVRDIIGSRRVAQVSVVVPDVARAARAWSALFGLPTPSIREPNLASQQARGLCYRGEPMQGATRIAFCYLENLDVEIIEPVGGPSVWSDFLATRPAGGGHHLAWVVPDAEATLAALEARGMPTLQTGTRAVGAPYGYAQAEFLGMYVEALGDPARTQPSAAGRAHVDPFAAGRDAERAAHREAPANALGPRRLAQVGFVVPDAGDAGGTLAGLFGAPAPSLQSTADDATTRTRYRGETTAAGLRWAMVQLDNITIELAEPLGAPSNWSDTLAARGPSMHHVALLPPDPGAARRHLEGLGYGEVQWGEWSGGTYSLHDTEADLGLLVEVLEHFA